MNFLARQSTFRKRTLSIIVADQIKEKVYELKITIDLPEGIQSIWRKIEIRGEASLVELGDAIQASFGWSGTHKHEFVAADESWKATSPQYGPPEFDDSYQNEEELLLKAVAPKAGHALTYNYDMTDPWSHLIEVTDIRNGGESLVTKLTDGARAGIPEDCGGASGFEEFLEALNPQDSEHSAMAAWYKTECPNGGGKYDPERIEFDQINKKLAAWSPS